MMRPGRAPLAPYAITPATAPGSAHLRRARIIAMSDQLPLPPASEPPPDNAWDQQFDRLRSRFPGVKDTILFCVHALQHGSDVDLEALKAQAAMYGLRITGASLNAARRALDPNAAPRPRRRTARVAATATDAAPAPPRVAAPRSRGRAAPPESQVEVEAMIRAVVAKVQADTDARLQRLRSAIDEALRILRDVLA